MPVTVRSFAKVNLGLRIGAPRADGFHELLTVYQTIGLHDVTQVTVARGSGIEIRCADPRVPRDESNTCFRIVEKAMQALGTKGRIVIEIDKRLPVQGGMAGASSNAVAVLLGLERALKKSLPVAEKLRIAAEVGSDLPLFLVGGTVLGIGRGEGSSCYGMCPGHARSWGFNPAGICRVGSVIWGGRLRPGDGVSAKYCRATARAIRASPGRTAEGGCRHTVTEHEPRKIDALSPIR